MRTVIHTKTDMSMTHPEILLAESTGYGYGERGEDRELTHNEWIEKCHAELTKRITLDNYSEYAEEYPQGTFDPVANLTPIPGGVGRKPWTPRTKSSALFYVLEICAEYDIINDHF